ncbi:Cro/CI family transcriptional regulator [Pseudomonas typographi]|uniref:Cro/CI family transcriptional regulator n=1 Tax=Pseudomonas typographi TaxID=2715964 RepID=UPI001685CF41|nr:Cro/CI family transcriptional regulator [Pseudomonas typographi]MBD1553595.1 hypothetical protein [Pseudomonas typographi]
MKTREAVGHFGSKRKLAEALGITPAAVSLWGESIPRLRQYQIQLISGGAVRVGLQDGDVESSCDTAEQVKSGPDGYVILSSTAQAAP